MFAESSTKIGWNRVYQWCAFSCYFITRHHYWDSDLVGSRWVLGLSFLKIGSDLFHMSLIWKSLYVLEHNLSKEEITYYQEKHFWHLRVLFTKNGWMLILKILVKHPLPSILENYQPRAHTDCPLKAYFYSTELYTYQRWWTEWAFP